jgi:hypothetical protein
LAWAAAAVAVREAVARTVEAVAVAGMTDVLTSSQSDRCCCDDGLSVSNRQLNHQYDDFDPAPT